MALPPRFNPLDRAVLEDPYPTYDALRSYGRIVRGGPGQLVITHYKDVSALLRSKKLSNEFPDEYRHFSVGKGSASEFLARVLLHRDPPVHCKLRRMLAVSVDKSKHIELQRRAEALVSELLDRALQSGAFDMVNDLALPLPILMICDLMGVPACDREIVRPYGVALSRAFKLSASEEDRYMADESVEFFRDYIKNTLFNSSSNTSSTELINAARRYQAKEGDFEEVVDNLIFLLFAGFETTSNLIATGSVLLTQNLSVIEQLRSQSSLVPSFIDEVLRFDAPIQSRARMVIEPIVLDNKNIQVGRVVLLLIGSANRDPAIFDRPDEFNILRPKKQHLSFGVGVHYCLGAQLARIEAHALFAALLSRCKRLYPNGQPVRDLTSVFRSYQSVPLKCI